MVESTVIVATRGVMGSGKSFWAKNWVAQDVRHRARVERDQLRAMMHDSVWKGRHTEDQILTAQYALIRALVKQGISVVVSDTNLDVNVFNGLRKLAEELNVTFRMQDFRDVPLSMCLSRNRLRTGKEYIPEDVIINTYNKYLGGE